MSSRRPGVIYPDQENLEGPHTQTITVGGGDCMRLAVSAAYEVAYEQTPAVFGGPGSGNALEFQRAYEEWAAELGYRWWISHDVAPCHLPRWIASVPGLDAGGTHAVVMAHDRLWFDPSSLTKGKVPAYGEVGLDDVLRAMWLDRSQATAIRGIFPPINGRPKWTRLTGVRGWEPTSTVGIRAEYDRAPGQGGRVK